MVIISTSTVAVSIQAVSPVSSSCARAKAGLNAVRAARAKPGRRRPAGGSSLSIFIIGRLQSVACSCGLNRIVAGFAGPDAYRLLHVQDEDLAVPDLAGIGGGGDGFDGLLHGLVPHH